MGDTHPGSTRIALITQLDRKTTCHPPVANWFSRQFLPAADSINSIHGETFRRVANPEHAAHLAKGLKVALLIPPTFFKTHDARLTTYRPKVGHSFNVALLGVKWPTLRVLEET